MSSGLGFTDIKSISEGTEERHHQPNRNGQVGRQYLPGIPAFSPSGVLSLAASV